MIRFRRRLDTAAVTVCESCGQACTGRTQLVTVPATTGGCCG